MRDSISYKKSIINIKIFGFNPNLTNTNSKSFDIRNANANYFEYA